MTVAAVAEVGIPGRRQPVVFLPLFVLAYFSVALALLATAAVSIPLRLSTLEPEHKAQLLSLTIGLGGVVVMLVTAPLGRLSDVSTSRSGIRRPYLLGGAIAGASGMLLLAFAPTVSLVVVGWCATQAGFAASSMALNALLADQIPVRNRARVAATFGLATGIAPAAGSKLVGGLPGSPIWWFGTPAAIALVANLALVFALRDIVRTERVRVRWGSLLRSYWINPVRHPDFGWAWLCRLLVTMSLVSVSAYLLYFLTDRLGVATKDAAGARRSSGARCCSRRLVWWSACSRAI